MDERAVTDRVRILEKVAEMLDQFRDGTAWSMKYSSVFSGKPFTLSMDVPRSRGTKWPLEMARMDASEDLTT